MRLRENCEGRDLLYSPSTTQHNFCFFKIHIFENYVFKQILKLTKMYLFWKICVWEKIVKEEIYCARLAQLSTTFVFSKFTFKKFFFFFWITIFWIKIWISLFLCAAQYCVYLEQPSTSSRFSKKQNGGAEIFFKILFFSKTVISKFSLRHVLWYIKGYLAQFFLSQKKKMAVLVKK